MKCYNWCDVKDKLTWMHFHVMRVDNEEHSEVYWDVDKKTLNVEDLRPWRTAPITEEEYDKAVKIGKEVLRFIDIKQTVESAKWCEYVDDYGSRYTRLVAPIMSVRMVGGVYDTYLFATFENQFSLTVIGEA